MKVRKLIKHFHGSQDSDQHEKWIAIDRQELYGTYLILDDPSHKKKKITDFIYMHVAF